MEEQWESDEWYVYFLAIATLLYLKVKHQEKTDMSLENSKLFQPILDARSPEDFHALCAQWINKLELTKKTKGA